MKQLLLILFFLFSSSRTPKEAFGEEYSDAMHILKKNYNRIIRAIETDNGNPSIILPIVFPEIIRYSMWRDMIETAYTEMRYVQNGPSSGYFSIGLFQIKPSFAEKVEKYCKLDNGLALGFDHIFTFSSNDPKMIRQERIERLKSVDWQVRYVVAFTYIVQNKFRLSDSMPMNQKIAFYSAAYNHDFACDSNEVVRWITKKTFPYGIKHENPYSYSEVANFFYHNDYRLLR